MISRDQARDNELTARHADEADAFAALHEAQRGTEAAMLLRAFASNLRAGIVGDGAPEGVAA